MAIEALDLHNLRNDTTHIGPGPRELTELRSTISHILLKELTVVEYLADLAHNACEMPLAEVAYIRMLEIYRSCPFSDVSHIRSLLDKMGSFYSELGESNRAKRCWSDILKLRDPPDQIHGIERNAWDSLAKSLPQTFGIISDVLRSKLTGVLPSMNLGTPVSADQTTGNTIYDSGPLGNSSHIGPSSDRTGSNCIHNAVASAANIVETIQRLPYLDLETRDDFKRTPLLLAAFLKQEDAGHALLMRIASCSTALPSSHLNVKDRQGQTVLCLAILSRCSTTFIRALIEKGAEINPMYTTKESYTPLQAACLTGNLDVASLLLDCGADINHRYPDSQHPTELAQINGHTEILRLIREKAKPSLQSSPPFFSQQHSQGGNDIISTVASNLSSPVGAMNSDALLPNAHSSTSPGPPSYLPADSDSDWNEYLNDDLTE